MCLQPFKYKCPEYINLCASGIWNLRPITPYTDHSLFCALTLSTVHFSVVWKLLCSRWPALAFLRGLKKGWLWQNEALWCFKLQICEPKSRLICTSGCKNRYYLWTNQLTERLQWKQVGSKTRLGSAVTVQPNSSFRTSLSGREASNCGSSSRRWKGSIQPAFCRHLPK